MKSLIFLCALLMLQSCNETEQNDSHRKVEVQITSDWKWSGSKLCIEGVTYIMAGHQFSVMLNTDSKIIPCNNESYK